MTIEYVRHRFTVHEYDQMAEAGILSEDDRLELIDGEIVQMTPIGRRHAASVKKLNRVFAERFGSDALVGVQDPIVVGEDSEPQPDVALLRPRSDYYAPVHPRPQDVLLLVEVADSSLELDRHVKLPMYARAGIQEVWLLDLTNDVLAVYRDPSPEGYRTVMPLRRGDWVAPLAFPGRELAVADVIG